MKRLFLLGALVVIPVMLAGAPPATKVDICHYDADSGTFLDLSVGPKAADAHLAQHESDYLGTCFVC